MQITDDDEHFSDIHGQLHLVGTLKINQNSPGVVSDILNNKRFRVSANIGRGEKSAQFLNPFIYNRSMITS